MRCAKHLLCRAPAVAQERDVWEDFNYSPWQPPLIAVIPPNKRDWPFSHTHRNTSRKDIHAVDMLSGAQCQAAEAQHEVPCKTSLSYPWQLFGPALLARSRSIPPCPSPNFCIPAAAGTSSSCNTVNQLVVVSGWFIPNSLILPDWSKVWINLKLNLSHQCQGGGPPGINGDEILRPTCEQAALSHTSASRPPAVPSSSAQEHLQDPQVLCGKIPTALLSC